MTHYNILTHYNIMKFSLGNKTIRKIIRRKYIKC